MFRHTFNRAIIGIFLFVTLIGCAPPSKVSEIRFSDNNFKKCILNLGIEDFTKITHIECSGMGIKSANEIKYFDQLTVLDLSFNNLSKLDVNANPNLQQINLWGQLTKSGIKSLTLGTLPKLTDLKLSGNQLNNPVFLSPTFEKHLPNLNTLTVYDMPANGSITLSIQHSKLRDLTISNPGDVRTLSTTLNLGVNAPALASLYINSVELESLSLKNSDQLETFIVTNTSLTSLALADMPNLTEAQVTNNKLSSLTLKNLPKLSYLNAKDNQISSLDSTELPAINKLYLANNQLESFDFSLFPNLAFYSLANNPLPKVEEQFSQDTSLYSCITRGNQRPFFSEIERIHCTGVPATIEKGDFTQFINLELLILTAHVKSGILDLSTLHNLRTLDLKVSNLITLRWPTDPTLEEVNLSNSEFENLSIPTMPTLRQLKLESLEHLKALTIPPQPNLSELKLERLQYLSTLTIESQPSLTSLVLYSIYLPKLTIHQAPKLTNLVISNVHTKHISIEDMEELEKIQILHTETESLSIENVPNLKEICLASFSPITMAITSNTLTNKELRALMTFGCR